MSLIHSSLSISTLHIMPLGTDGLACNHAHTLFLLDGSAVELVRKASTEGQQFSNTDLGTPEKLQRCLSDSYLLLGCGDLGSFFFLGIMILEQISQNADC